ncbi:MAG: lamin tail domain-containing protein [Verrucomicrobia bacterium]|nr:lamin tail domain-containing protein [Verrucomicrobiota bacterium]
MKHLVRLLLVLALAAAGSIRLTAAPLELIPLTNAVWHYFQNNLDGFDWPASGFDDRAWPSGPSLLAFEENAAITPLVMTPLDDPRIAVDGVAGHACYFRIHFDWPLPTNHVTLRFTCRIDDCAALYLNGVLLTNLGVTTLNSFASLGRGALGAGTDAAGDETFSVVPGSLLTGDNVLAVEVHQVSTTSSDVVWGARVEGEVDTTPPTLVRQTPAPGSVVGSLTAVDVFFSEAVTNVRASDLHIAGVAATNVVPVDPSQYRFGCIQPPTGAVQLAFSPTQNIRDLAGHAFAGTNWTCTLDTNLPPLIGQGLVHRYSFTVDAGDSVGTAHGLLLGGATISGGAVVLNGSSAYVDLPNNLVTGLTAVTFETWVVNNGSGNWARIFDFGNNTGGENAAGTGTQYMFLTPGPGPGVLRAAYTPNGNASEQMVQWNTALPTGVPKHVVLTTDGATARGRLYVDGVLVGSNDAMTITPEAVGPTVNNWLGRSQWSADAYLNGSITEFRIYNTALTAEEVMQNFQLGPEVASQGGPVKLIAHPQSQTVDELKPVTFRVTYSGGRPVSLQWLRNGQPVSGATNDTFTIPSAALGDHGAVFRVALTNTVNNTTYTATTSNAVLTVIADLTPPAVARAASLFPDGVMVEFSEGVRPDTATNLSNFAITSAGGPLTITSVAFSGSSSNLFLTTAPQVLGTLYTLTVNGVFDLADASNPIATNSQVTFTAVDYAATNVGHPAIAASFTSVAGGHDLTAGGSGIGGTNDQFAFGSRLLLGNFDVQARLDSLQFSHAWARAGLMARDGFATNAAFAASFATPGPAGCFFAARTNAGAAAEIGGSFPANLPDTWLRLRRTGNVFDGFASLDGQTWEFLGSATLAMSSAAQVGFALSAGVTNASTTAGFRDIGPGSGVLATNAPLPFEPPGPCSRRTALVITEIMYDPPATWAGTNNLEFIELWNSGLVTEDLTGHRLTGDISFTFPAGTKIAPGQFLVIANDPVAAQNFYGVPCLGPYTNNLANNGGTLRLLNELGGRLLEIEYDNQAPWPVAPGGAGHSLVLRRASYGENDARAWAASEFVGGSAGRGEHFRRDPLSAVVINEFLANTDAPALDYVELFNTSLQPLDLSGAWLSDEANTNKFRIADGTTIPARGFLAFDQTQLGFALSSDGERLFLVNAERTRVLDAVAFGGQATGVASGRYPDGAPDFRELSAHTPGTNNAAPLARPLVLNEIMYHPISGLNDDEYIEISNRGSNAVDLTEWQIDGGVRFTFPSNAVIAAGGYVVVAENLTNLLAKYPHLSAASTFGNYSGNLRNGGERLVLQMPEYAIRTNAQGFVTTNLFRVTVNEVPYQDGGRWGRWSDGGGSSLELTDPRADTRCAASWADSDESAKAPWTALDVTALLENGQTADMINQGGYLGAPTRFEFFLQDAGEAIVDDLQFLNNGGPNLVSNGDFAGGTNGYTLGGVLRRSFVEAGVGAGGSQALHLVATDRGDAGPNKVSTVFTATIVTNPPNTGTIRAQVRWLKGSPYILFRTRGHWMEVSQRLNVPANCGTPGLPNSRLVANAGPVITEVSHAPVLPAAGQAVVVTARVADPDGVGPVTLNYRLDPASAISFVAMTDDGLGADALSGDGIYSAAIPAQSTGTLAAFSLSATDAAAVPATRQFPARAPTDECLVRWGESTIGGSLGTYRLWLTATNIAFWTLRERNANDPIDATFVYGNSRAIYNVRTLYSGSPFHTPIYSGPLGANPPDYEVNFNPDEKFLGSEPFVLTAFDVPNGNFFFNDKTAQVDLTGNWLARKLGQPFNCRRHVHVVLNGLRRGTIYDDAQQPNAEFLDEYFPNDQAGELRKIEDWFEFADNAQDQGITTASLQRFNKATGELDTKRYRWTWRPRATDHPDNWFALTNLLVAVNDTANPNYVNRVRAWLDVPNCLRPIITHHIAGDWDSYGYERGKNMYAYKPDTGSWRFLMWDIELGLGVASGRPATDSIYNIQDARLSALIQSTPAFNREYLAGFLEAINTTLLPGAADMLLDERYASLLQNNLGVASPQSIKDYLSQRRTYLISQMPSAQFSVTGTNFVTVAASNLVAFTGTAPVNVRDIVVNGVPYAVTWTGLTSWSLRVPVLAGTNGLTFQGRDLQGTLLSNATASVTVNYTGAASAPDGGVVFSEIMFHPVAPGAAYVELFNTTTNFTFDLSGWRINGLGFTFPAGAIMTPRSFLVLAKDATAFATAYGATVPVFAVFDGELDLDGETLTLLKPGVTPAADLVVDRVRYEPQLPWPQLANGAGGAVQVIDSAQDNSRVGNWATVTEWRYVTATGTANSSRLYLYLAGVGDVFIDDLKLVAGVVPEAGTNRLRDGDFESPLAGNWNLPAANGASHLSATNVHTGAGSFHLVSTNPAVVLNAIVTQDITPALTAGQTYTLSYWYRPKTATPNLILRMSAGTLNSTITSAPQMLTPGAANSTLAPFPLFPPLWLNEVQTINTAGLADLQGEREPWVEVFNAGTNAVPLDGLYLASGYDDLTLQLFTASTNVWPFPSNAVLNPGEFKIVFADGEPGEATADEWHTSFRLNGSTGAVALVRLVNNAPQIVDYLNFTGLGTNRSYGSFPDGQPFYREEFFHVTPGGTNNALSAPLVVFINEWMAANAGFVRDPADNDAEDWFELYNPNTTTVNLGGCYLTDNLTNQFQYQVPNNGQYTIPPGGFLLVWADGETGQNRTNRADLHVNFNLRQAGEAIGVFAADGTLIDAVAFSAQTSDVSEGRYPDGAAARYSMTTPTPRAPNVATAPPEPPRAYDVALQAGGVVSFSVATVVGWRYQVEFKNDLSLPGWLPLGDLRNGTGGVISITDAITNSPQRYYRVVIVR